MIVRQILYESDLPTDGLTMDEVLAGAVAWMRSTDTVTYPEEPATARRRMAAILAAVSFSFAWASATSIVAVQCFLGDKPVAGAVFILLSMAVPALAVVAAMRAWRNRNLIARILVFDGADFVMHHSGLGPWVPKWRCEDPDFRTRFIEEARYVEEWRVPALMPIRVQIAPTEGRVPGALDDIFFMHEGRRYVFARSGTSAQGVVEHVDQIGRWHHEVETFIRENAAQALASAKLTQGDQPPRGASGLPS